MSSELADIVENEAIEAVIASKSKQVLVLQSGCQWAEVKTGVLTATNRPTVTMKQLNNIYVEYSLSKFNREIWCLWLTQRISLRHATSLYSFCVPKLREDSSPGRGLSLGREKRATGKIWELRKIREVWQPYVVVVNISPALVTRWSCWLCRHYLHGVGALQALCTWQLNPEPNPNPRCLTGHFFSEKAIISAGCTDTFYYQCG